MSNGPGHEWTKTRALKTRRVNSIQRRKSSLIAVANIACFPLSGRARGFDARRLQDSLPEWRAAKRADRYRTRLSMFKVLALLSD
jgi:hypothetical protein